MNKVWHCAALALLLSGCSLPFSLSQPAEPKLETKVPTETTRLKAWLALSERVLHSNDTQRQQAMKLLKIARRHN